MSLLPFIIDCDTGRDDALTLWLATQAKLPLKTVIASYGNTTLSNVYDNTARVLSLANCDHIPLLAGLERPPRLHKLFQRVVEIRQKNSGNGICNLELPTSNRPLVVSSSPQKMSQALKDLSYKNGVLDYFIIGPASNFSAIAQELGSELKNVVARVTMLGGKFSPLWDELPGADFNIASDPYALQNIMQLGLSLRFVPLNATWPIHMTLSDIEALHPLTSLAKWAQDIMIAHCRYFAPEPIFRFHDPSILLAAQHEEGFVEKNLILISDEKSDDFGRLVEVNTGVLCQVYQTGSSLQISFKHSILRWLGFSGF